MAKITIDSIAQELFIDGWKIKSDEYIIFHPKWNSNALKDIQFSPLGKKLEKNDSVQFVNRISLKIQSL